MIIIASLAIIYRLPNTSISGLVPLVLATL